MIAVAWYPERCIHSARCVAGLPGVSDPARKPWVDLKGHSADEIAAVAQRCPSGALQLRRKDTTGRRGPSEQPEAAYQGGRNTDPASGEQGRQQSSAQGAALLGHGQLLLHLERCTACREWRRLDQSGVAGPAG